MRDRHQTGRTIRRRPEVVTVARLRLTGMDTHPNPQRPRRTPLTPGQDQLRVDVAANASCAVTNTACMPSPVDLTTWPPCASTEARRNVSCRANVSRIDSGCSSHRRVPSSQDP